jgi:integrase
VSAFPERAHRYQIVISCHQSLGVSPVQARTFLEAAREDRLEALYVVALHCGLRQGELFGLRWSDVDLEEGTLRVNRTLSQTKDGPVFTFPRP